MLMRFTYSVTFFLPLQTFFNHCADIRKSKLHKNNEGHSSTFVKVIPLFS